MTTPAPDWADEISLAACGPTEQGLYVANALRAAYERGKAEGERLGYIKGLREAADIADDYARAETAGKIIRARADDIEQEADNAK